MIKFNKKFKLIKLLKQTRSNPMSIRTHLNPMGAGTCLLTIITNPSSASCTLTYGGKSYTTKTLRVVKGATVDYAIYESTYGWKTGSFIITQNTTKTFTGTTTPVYTDTTFSKPTLSANGTLGGSAFAVASSHVYSSYYSAYRAFDNSASYYWSTGAITNNTDIWLTFYNPLPLKVTKLVFNYYYAGCYWKSGYLQGSNDNSNWTNIAKLSPTANNATQTMSFSSNTSFYNYHRIYGKAQIYNNVYGVILKELTITATQRRTTYSYSWEVS